MDQRHASAMQEARAGWTAPLRLPAESEGLAKRSRNTRNLPGRFAALPQLNNGILAGAAIEVNHL